MKNTPTAVAEPIQSLSSQAVIGCLETLNQGLEFLEKLSSEDYTSIADPHVTSSIGEHYRHWLDLFHAIRLDSDKIDYNVRRRGHSVEREINTAKQEIKQLIEWLFKLPASRLDKVVIVETEVLLSHTCAEEVQSSLARELTFAALHATHHFAMIKVLASLRGIASDNEFGLAPATASYQRAQ
ncbi:hypothetical protein GCM10007938_24580 [Vibrio zhanjiangensis]|uniref:DinB family protein n=1 Tax=Vibrio zhanjiangensis TaxID=1046128 RepID=A0ABQ6F097_9VIBR|nr:DinB family protein [Vibrio zhanjiangensis]GLT18677.1 hypothetical protein GCM10007938_24580 [Vibrio zhanjiangensis]